MRDIRRQTRRKFSAGRTARRQWQSRGRPSARPPVVAALDPDTGEQLHERGVTNVTVNCVHPGVFRSNLGSSGGPNPLWMAIVTAMGRPFLTSAQKAAERVLYLATAPEAEGVSGKYYGSRVDLPAPPQKLDPAARARLWDRSAALTQPDVVIPELTANGS